MDKHAPAVVDPAQALAGLSGVREQNQDGRTLALFRAKSQRVAVAVLAAAEDDRSTGDGG